jgi:hypothetical protein
VQVPQTTSNRPITAAPWTGFITMAISGILLVGILGAMCLCANAYPYPDSAADFLEDMARHYEDVDEQLLPDGAEMPQDDDAFNPSFPKVEEEEDWPLEDAETEAFLYNTQFFTRSCRRGKGCRYIPRMRPMTCYYSTKLRKTICRTSGTQDVDEQFSPDSAEMQQDDDAFNPSFEEFPMVEEEEDWPLEDAETEAFLYNTQFFTRSCRRGKGCRYIPRMRPMTCYSTKLRKTICVTSGKKE